MVSLTLVVWAAFILLIGIIKEYGQGIVK